MKRVAIVGGGIAGLSAAYYLEKARQNGAGLEWTLFEKSGRLGGVLRTEYRDGYIIEAGPDSFLTEKPDASRLCHDLGLWAELIHSNDSERKTYILVKNRLVLMPDGLQFMVPTRLLPMITTPLFSLGAKLRMAREWFRSPNSNHNHQGQDESVAAFVRRHFGQEMVDRVAEPLLSGVFGGDVERLSVQAVLLRFVTMEREHGSLVRASLKKRKASSGAKPAPLFTSLRKGVQQLVDALLLCLPKESLRVGNSVAALERSADRWKIPGTNQAFDSVLLATPAPAAAGLLSTIDPEIAARLQRIQYTSSVAVALAYPSAKLPPGFGFLVPRSEGRKLMACTFVHNKFFGRAPEGTALLRCFFSSSRVPGLLEYHDDELRAFALQEIKDILGLDDSPQFSCVFRWQQGLPQYELGHLERASEIESRLAQTPGLQLIGNSLYGVGIPDCIKSARLAVEKIG
ncbi:MAG TPA: protoporphyrinogen oxidase [Candidatus Angelobacter sp.]|jgi:oxygen-dependent protoporphyrinogen oxidase|nr:protoporphyrinogen oxidase [Candidatus Angelobacter sp.]